VIEEEGSYIEVETEAELPAVVLQNMATGNPTGLYYVKDRKAYCFYWKSLNKIAWLGRPDESE
jgi:hypothetical protein